MWTSGADSPRLVQRACWNSNRPHSSRLVVLKDEFEHFWTYRYRRLGEERHPVPTLGLDRRPSAVAFRVHDAHVCRHACGDTPDLHILAFIDRPLTGTAVGEGLNRIVKIVKNRANRLSSRRNPSSPIGEVYLATVGDLDIPAQIPSQLRRRNAR